MIQLHFEKLAYFNRYHEICSVSIPFAQGEFVDINQLTIYDSLNQITPHQTKILSRWPDHSIRWIYIVFMCNLKGNLSTDYFASIHPRTSDRPQITKTLSSIETSNQSLDFRLLKEDTLRLYDGISPIEFHVQTMLSDAQSNTYVATLDNLELQTLMDGPLRYQYRGYGKHLLAQSDTDAPAQLLDYEMTFTLDYQKPWIQVDYRLINKTASHVSLSKIDVAITSHSHSDPSKKTASPSVLGALATSNYKSNIVTSTLTEPLSQLIDGDYLMKDANEHYPETFYGTAFVDYFNQDAKAGLCATHYQAYQNFPKGMTVNKDGLVLELLPDVDEPLTLYAGMAKTHTYFLHLHQESIEDDASTSYDDLVNYLNLQSLQFQMPDRPTLDSSIYQSAGVLENIYTQSPSPDIDQKMLNKADRRSRGFGILNWGDAPDMNYTNQGRAQGNLVWTNNEYDFPHAAMLLYTKTGVRRMMDYCLVAGRHQMDVDVCHAPDLGLRYQGQIEHSGNHHTGDVKPCHQWVEGLLDYYHLTGEDTALSTALGIGENILKLLTLPRYAQSGGINARETGWAMRSLIGLYKETHDEKWLAPTQKIIQQFKEWYDTYGGWLAPYTDHTVIRVPFMISVAVGSLMRYYRIRPDESIRDLIIHAIDDMCENCMLPDGSFYYKELPSLQRPSYNTLVLEALAIAYELTSDKKYLTAGLKTFEKLGQDGTPSAGKRIYDTFTLVTGGLSPKAFAQSYHALAFFYKQLEESEQKS